MGKRKTETEKKKEGERIKTERWDSNEEFPTALLASLYDLQDHYGSLPRHQGHARSYGEEINHL
jgi:hypothetical protein